MEHRMKRDMIKKFENSLIQDEKSGATIQKYVRDVENFFSFCNEREVTKELVICYKRYLIEHYAPSSVNSMLVALNCFLKEMGWYDCVVKLLKIQHQAFRTKDKELSKEEYYRLLYTAKAQKKNRLYLLMQTLCATGIRISELRFITVEAIKKGWAIVSLKGKTRRVLIPSALCQELKQYVKEQNIQKESIFVSRNGKPLDRSNVAHAMKALCEAANVEKQKVYPHNLRHLFACLYYKEEKDISRLADLLGHSSVNTTRIYICTSSEEHAKQIEKLGLII